MISEQMKNCQQQPDNKIRDGIIGRASEEVIKYTTQWKVTEENVDEKTAEMINFTAAAQNLRKHSLSLIKSIIPSKHKL